MTFGFVYTFLGMLLTPVLLLSILLVLTILVFEIVMFIDVVTNERISTERKLLWVIAMFLLHPFVAIAYYFTDHKQRS